MKTTRCDKQTCFACRTDHCQVLQEAIRDRPCPFYKTDFQLEEGRMEARQHLKDIGRDDLIEQYTSNYDAYRL